MKLLKRGSFIAVLLVTAFLLTAVTPAVAAPQIKVRIWVSYQSNRRAEVFQALDKAKATFHYDFPELESYVVSLPEAALNGIVRNPFVTGVEGDPARYPIAAQQGSLEKALAASLSAEGQTVPWGIDAVQARDVWDVNRDGTVDTGAPTGAGIKVCIIDSGYYAGHEDLQDIGAGITGVSQVDDNWARDGLGHGSHVAGTISAENNNLGVVGVTPGTISFHIVKIFDDTGAWTSASDLTAAIYSCRDNGANVISMSLGGTSSNRKEQRAFDSLYSGGILHVAAAGNEQVETPGAFSYPASYSSVMSVAAVDESMAIADFSLQNSAVEIAAPGVGVLSTIPYVETNNLAVDGVNYNANHIEFSGYGSASGTLVDGGRCGSTGNWSGRVVLCERGDISFYDKVINVQNSGGAAAIIYNNEPGPFLGTLGDATSAIIGLSLSQEDGQYLVANKLGSTAVVTSELLSPASGYEAWDGTSMATPHVAGVAALIWSFNPNLTNLEIREALTATALDLGVAGRDNLFGYGLVQAKDALQFLGGGSEDYPPSVTLTNPTNGATVEGSISVTADASDDNGVTQVEFFVDGTSVGVDSNGIDGWTAEWDTTAYANGSYTVSATATDTEGQTASDSVSVTVDNGGVIVDNPPSVTLTSPTDGATVSGLISVTADAFDDNGVTQVEFFVDGTSIGVDNSGIDGWTAEWDTIAYANGNYTISATATDTESQTTSDSISVDVDNGGGTTDPLTLSALGYKVRGQKYVDLSWVGATSANIDVYRDGSLVITTANDMFYTDGPLGVGGGSNTYQICEAGSTTNCSDEVTWNW
jgi:subtilisin family serine protease